MKKKVLILAVLAAVSSVFAASDSGKDVGNPEKSLKVLMIGNSFSICNLKQMPHVAKSMGLKLDLASGKTSSHQRTRRSSHTASTVSRTA